LVYPAYCPKVLGLDSDKVSGNSLSLFLYRVVLYSSSIGHYTVDNLYIYFSGIEQAIPLCGHSEPSKGELLGSELLLYSVKVALPLEFTVDLDTKKPGFLD
jgi:hypothetical protein